MMPAPRVKEAAAIVVRTTDMLLATSNEQRGRSGSDLRRACGDMRAHAEEYIIDNVIADKLANCFLQARLTGATLDEFDRIREAVVAEVPVSFVAKLMKNACLGNALEQMARTVLTISFTSREDVDMVRKEVSAAFDQAEESAADEMESTVYRALATLHAAVTYYLYDTVRPLPRMLDYSFAAPRPTLVMSHRLYDTAGRADELREENKIIHPAFAPRSGKALGA